MTQPGDRPLGVALAWQCHGFEALLRLARRAEALGYAALFVDGDASQMGRQAPRDVLDGWTVTTALLARTQRIDIGSMRITHHWNAARLAQSAATAVALFGSRFRFLISIGGQPVDAAFGLDFPDVAARIRWLDETLGALRALWRGERVSWRGEFVRLDGAIVRPIPRPGGIPIAVAARGTRLLDVVAAHADVWDVNLPPVRARVERAVQALDRACERVGRDPRGIARTMWIFTRACPPGAASVRHRDEFRRLNPWFRSVCDSELAEALVVGTPGECRRHLGEIREELQISLPILDLSGLPEGEAAAQLDALAPGQSSVDSGSYGG